MAPQLPPRQPDTPQQKQILRTHRTSRIVREHYGRGTRVRAIVSGVEGTVARHVPGNNAQGGSLTILWDTGILGRGHGPSQVEILD